MNGSARFESSGAYSVVTCDDSRIEDVRISMLRASEPLRKPVESLFGRNRGQRACWWGSRARREVVVCHVGLVVDGSGHCV